MDLDSSWLTAPRPEVLLPVTRSGRVNRDVSNPGYVVYNIYGYSHCDPRVKGQMRIERLRVTSQGVWLPLILMLQSCKFFKVILEAQVTQICSMDILRLTIDFIKMSKVWFLCMEFYGAWQEVAMHHRTPYIRTKLWTFL